VFSSYLCAINLLLLLSGVLNFPWWRRQREKDKCQIGTAVCKIAFFSVTVAATPLRLNTVSAPKVPHETSASFGGDRHSIKKSSRPAVDATRDARCSCSARGKGGSGPIWRPQSLVAASAPRLPSDAPILMPFVAAVPPMGATAGKKGPTQAAWSVWARGERPPLGSARAGVVLVVSQAREKL